MVLAAFTFADFPTLPLSGATQLGDRHRLVELRDRAEHLAHQARRPQRIPAHRAPAHQRQRPALVVGGCE